MSNNRDHATNSMMVDLRVSTWTARKQDKRVSKEVATSHNMGAHMGSYYKSLVSSNELAEVNRLVSAARAAHYKWTLPWLDSGPRVLPAAVFFEYSQEMAEYRNAFNDAVDRFIDVYDHQKEEARKVLGTTYSPEDYPASWELAYKFGFVTHFAPVPTGNDFRCEIPQAEADQIREQVEQTTNQAMESAVVSLYSRMADVVSAFVERLGESDKVFRDSLVENARELVDILPRLNVTGNERIAKLSARIKDCLCKYEPSHLRASPAVREKTYQEAVRIQDDLADFLRG